MKPKLRFMEFNSDWNKTTLKNIAIINPKNETLPDKFIYIDLESVNKGILSQEKIISKSDAPSRAQRTIKKNDILFQTVRPYQQNNYFVKEINDLPYVASTGYALIRTKENPYFIYSLLHKKEFLDKVIDRCTGTSFPAISSNDLADININIPDIQEQTKVSNFLSLLDKKIELQSKKIEDLKLFKKGLLYKEFNDKQKNKKLSDCFKFGKAGGTPKSTVKEYYDGSIPFLSISDMTSQGKYLERTEKSISELGLNSSSAWLVPSNSLIISMYASYGLVSINKIDLATSQAMFDMIIKDEDNNEYIYYYLYYLYITNYYDSIVSTGTQPNLNAEQLKNLFLYMPSREEQLKISKKFITFDKKINLETNKLIKLVELKKGLMQSMFV